MLPAVSWKYQILDKLSSSLSRVTTHLEKGSDTAVLGKLIFVIPAPVGPFKFRFHNFLR